MTRDERDRLVERITVLIYPMNVTRDDITKAMTLANKIVAGYKTNAQSRKDAANAVKRLASTFDKKMHTDSFNDDLESALYHLSLVSMIGYDLGVERVEGRKRDWSY